MDNNQQGGGPKIESHVYVQHPDGKEQDIEKKQAPNNDNPEDAKQTAENVPTKASKEVVDGEGG